MTEVLRKSELHNYCRVFQLLLYIYTKLKVSTLRSGKFMHGNEVKPELNMLYARIQVPCIHEQT
jgi:hypothetical protein